MLDVFSEVGSEINDRSVAVPLVQPSESLAALRKKTKKFQSSLRGLVSPLSHVALKASSRALLRWRGIKSMRRMA